MFTVCLSHHICVTCFCSVFFFNDTATTEIYTYLHTLSLHDALPISSIGSGATSPTPSSISSGNHVASGACMANRTRRRSARAGRGSTPSWRCCGPRRSEEHTSELQSLMRISYAVFCLKKKKNNIYYRLRQTYQKTSEE